MRVMERSDLAGPVQGAAELAGIGIPLREGARFGRAEHSPSRKLVTQGPEWWSMGRSQLAVAVSSQSPAAMASTAASASSTEG
jgi:hypothetical protein